jgi:hypothetical protein
MNWKAWIHSFVIALLSILLAAVEQYFKTGGVVPQTSTQWHLFFASVIGTAIIAIPALLKQSPLLGSVTDPAPGGVQTAGTPVSVVAKVPDPTVLVAPIPKP